MTSEFKKVPVPPALLAGDRVRQGPTARYQGEVRSIPHHAEMKSGEGPGASKPKTSSLVVGGVEITRTFRDNCRPDGIEAMSCGDAFVATVQLRGLHRKKLWRDHELVLDGGQKAGDLTIGDLRHRWRYQHFSSFDSVSFQIPFSTLRSFAEDAGRPEFRTLSCRLAGPSDDVMLGLARALLPSFEYPLGAHPLFLEQIKLAMLAHLIQAYGGVYLPSRKKSILAPWQEKRVVELMVTHVGEPLSIAELAAACELSRSYFIKAFKESFSCTPHRWLTEYRIARAKDLLCLDMPIAEVALVCGFADQSHMTRAFSEHVGVSPGRFRQEAQISRHAD